MASQIDVLMAKLHGIQHEIEVELAKRREAKRFHFENRRIVFEAEVLRVQRAIRTGLSRYIRMPIR
jgi:hypothetical protein